MKKIFLSICICLLLTGCFSYTDINTAMFATAAIIDMDEEQNVKLYVETFHAYRSSTNNAEKGERIIFVGKGKTLFDATRNLSESTSYRLNFEQNRIFIFTERAAKYGLDNFLDILNRDQESLLRALVLITKEEPETLLNLELKQEEYLGLIIYDLMESRIVSSAIQTKKLYEYLNQRKIGKNVDVITLIQVDEQSLQDNIRAHGAAIVQNDKLVGEIEPRQLQTYNLIKGEMNRGVLTISHPKLKNKYVSIEILKNRTRVEMEYKENKIYLKKIIDMKLSFAETQKKIILDKETINDLEEEIKSKLRRDSLNLFKEYQEKDIDIFKVQEEFERRYPHADVKDALKITELTVEIEPYIEGSSDTQSFR